MIVLFLITKKGYKFKNTFFDEGIYTHIQYNTYFFATIKTIVSAFQIYGNDCASV